ncbi:urease accessory protein UreE [Halorientalis marina]|uniref:urease accessory protein UreE n=1 Tax=Halorientalis marina TaxID=2931976 RepID=UPI001FF4C31D|nr:urease accessory protein UreE [Halorientalis marina]
MLVVDSILGNADDDPDLAARVAERPDDEVERVVLDERDRRRARLRTTTEAGTELGIVAPEDGLRPGDVLVADDERAVVVAFADRDALVVDFAGVPGSADALAGAAALGHRLGNRHRDLAVRDGEILVALDADEDQVRETVAEAAPPGATVREETVDPALFDGTDPHSHGDGSGHAHPHDDHTHSHGGDHTHDHSGEEHTHGGVHTVDDPEEGSS